MYVCMCIYIYIYIHIYTVAIMICHMLPEDMGRGEEQGAREGTRTLTCRKVI